MNKLGLPITFLLVLTACGAPQTTMPTAVQRLPDIEVALPAATDMPMHTTALNSGLRAQATVPAWTGPLTFGDYAETRGTSQLGVNSVGQLFINIGSASAGGYSARRVQGYTSTGASLGSIPLQSGKSASGMALSPASNSRTVTVIQQPISINGNPYPVSKVGPFSSPDSLPAPKNGEIQVAGGIRLGNDYTYELEATDGSSVAFLDRTPSSQRFTSVYELDFYSGPVLSRQTPVLYPKNLTGYDADRVAINFSTSKTSPEAYVVMVFPATGCTDTACPSLFNVQQIRNGQVQWSRVWKNAKPVKLQDISANKNEVVILTTDGAPNPDTAEGQTQLTWVRNDGTVTLRQRVPLELWRRDWARNPTGDQYSIIPNMKFLQTDDTGRLLLNNANALLSGTFAEGLSNIYVLDDRDTNYRTQKGTLAGKAVFSGDYVYTQGVTYSNLGNPSSAPDVSNTTNFLVPLDFQLNPRAPL